MILEQASATSVAMAKTTRRKNAEKSHNLVSILIALTTRDVDHAIRAPPRRTASSSVIILEAVLALILVLVR